MNKFSKVFLPGVAFYLIIILLFIIVSFIENIKFRLAIGFALLCIVIMYAFFEKNIKKRKLFKYIDSVNSELELKNKNIIQKFPLPLLVTSGEGQIIAYNNLFNQICDVKEDDEIVTDIIEKVLRNASNKKDKISENIIIKNCDYHIIGNYVNVNNSLTEKHMLMLYFIDETEKKMLAKKIEETKLVSSVIVIDNYEELTQNIDESVKPQILAEIDVKLTNWIGFTNGILKKYERDKYILIFENKYLEELESKKFDIIDIVKEINVGNKIPVTLSIGIGINANDFITSFKQAMAAIDIGLGRGGDQVVINDGNKLSFFGGRSQDVEKRTRVKARVIAQGFEELLQQSDRVIIMGHKNADMDVIGSAIGIYRIAKESEKEANIVLDNITSLTKNLIEKISEDEEYDNLFVNSNKALNIVTKNTLIVVVDTHKPSLVECPELLEFSQNVVVIDHHRKAQEFINNAVLIFHETFASSTCEMITEMNYYLKANFKLIEAEALYAGIVLDTKNFTIKTGARTFDAAASLKRIGIDTLNIRKIFQNDFDALLIKSDVIKNADIKDNIAISICDVENTKDLQLITAQSADTLLEINGVEASFVLSKSENKVIISGRSMGSINVQVILEKLGGGGHLTVAGAQLQDTEIEEAKKMLEEKIEEYKQEQIS